MTIINRTKNGSSPGAPGYCDEDTTCMSQRRFVGVSDTHPVAIGHALPSTVRTNPGGQYPAYRGLTSPVSARIEKRKYLLPIRVSQLTLVHDSQAHTSA